MSAEAMNDVKSGLDTEAPMADDIGTSLRGMTTRLSAEIAQFAKTIIEAHRADLREILNTASPARIKRRRSSR